MSICIKCLKKEATLRCKMCHSPICRNCVISTPVGIFCSELCIQKMQSHIEKVKEIDKNKPIIKRKRIPAIVKFIIVLIALWLVAHFLGIDIVARIKQLISLLTGKV